jgi:hypothetical protein
MLGPCWFVDLAAWSSKKQTMEEVFASAGGSIANWVRGEWAAGTAHSLVLVSSKRLGIP